MKLLWDKELTTVKKDYQFVGSYTHKDFLVIALRYKIKGEFFIELQKIDSKGELIHKHLQKLGKLRYAPDLHFIYSKDRNFCATVFSTKSSTVSAFTFDVKALKLTYKIEDLALLEDIHAYNDLDELLLTNKGEVLAIFQRNIPRKQNNKLALYRFGKILDNSKYLQHTIDLFDIRIFDVAFRFDEATETLIGAGLYDHYKGAKANGYFLIQFPLFDVTAYQVYRAPFSGEFLHTIKGRKSKEGQGFVDAYVKDIIVKSNGGAILVAERYREITPTFKRPMSEEFNTRQNEHYYNDIVLVDIQPDGTSKWGNVFYKRQYSREDGGISSSFFLMKTPKNARFIYNEQQNSRYEVSEFVMNRMGQQDRNAVMNTKGFDLKLLFKYALQTNRYEVITPSVYRGELKLVKLDYRHN